MKSPLGYLATIRAFSPASKKSSKLLLTEDLKTKIESNLRSALHGNGMPHDRKVKIDWQSPSLEILKYLGLQNHATVLNITLKDNMPCEQFHHFMEKLGGVLKATATKVKSERVQFTPEEIGPETHEKLSGDSHRINIADLLVGDENTPLAPEINGLNKGYVFTLHSAGAVRRFIAALNQYVSEEMRIPNPPHVSSQQLM